MSNLSMLRQVGSSAHAKEDRADYDFYATEPKATELLLEVEKFNNKVWECACGNGHISEVLFNNGYNVRSSDLIVREYPCEQYDFLGITNQKLWDGDIITNPPYKLSTEFVYKAMNLLPNGNKLAMFLPIQFLESKTRKELFKQFPPMKLYVSSSRLICAKNGEFEKYNSAVKCYAWYIWQQGYSGPTIIKWIN